MLASDWCSNISYVTGQLVYNYWDGSKEVKKLQPSKQCPAIWQLAAFLQLAAQTEL